MPHVVDPDLYAKANNKPSIVYLATNTVNGKRYIGTTGAGLRRRSKQHIAAALRGKNYCAPFYRAIRKYGAQSFTFTVLVECPTVVAAALEEVRLIAEMAPEYNASGGGESIAGVGFEQTEKMREAARLANLGRPGYWTGKKRPDIAEGQRKRLTGRADLIKHLHAAAHTPEVRAKASATKIARGFSNKQREACARRRKKIICLNDGKVYFGAKAAAEAYGLKWDSVSRVLIGERSHIRGYQFKHDDGSGE